MAQSNKRYFNTFFFEDPYIEELDSETTLLYITMILNPHNNLAGCYEVTVRKLMNYTKLSEDKVKLGIQKLVEDRKILFSGNWLALKNFIKNNNFNPNMCKSAFDIMKSAPADKVLFILSNHTTGQLEPWVTEFIPKVESGINAKIDSQNRSAIKEAEKKGLPHPKPKSHQSFTPETLMNELSDSKTPTIREPFPQPLPQPSAEYKGEIEYKSKYELEIEKEIEVVTIDEPSTPTYKPNYSNSPKYEETPVVKLSDLITESINHWNSFDNLPVCKYSVMNVPKVSEITTKFDVFRDGEIIQAISNFSKYFEKVNPKFRAKNFHNFITNSVDNWLDENECREMFESDNQDINEDVEIEF